MKGQRRRRNHSRRSGNQGRSASQQHCTMARGKRRAPVAPAVMQPEEIAAEERGDLDAVDEFVEQRQRVMLAGAGVGVQEDVEEAGTGVVPVMASDSESEGDSSDDDDEEEGEEDKKDWGARRGLWYGGDTHDYEIMSDEERGVALEEEEGEAVRMQGERLAGMTRQDFVEEDDEDDEDGTELDAEEGEEADGDAAAEVLEEAAPEVPLLLREMAECRERAAEWKTRLEWGPVARTRYHIYAAFVTNVAFYLALRTDPDAVGVDLRNHPVLAQIVRLRKLLKESLSVPAEKPPLVPQPSPAVAASASKTGGLAAGDAHPDSAVLEKTKKKTAKKERRKARAKSKKRALAELEGADPADGDQKDDQLIRNLLSERAGDEDSSGAEVDLEAEASKQKRKKLNRIVGAMERDRKHNDARRIASADVDTVRADAAEPRKQKSRPGRSEDGNDADMAAGNSADVDGGVIGTEPDFELDEVDDEAFMKRMMAKKAKKEAKAARKEELNKPHVYSFKDDVDEDTRRKATTQVLKNRGLTRQRPKDKKTPRVKKRLAYEKAVKRRKGAVRDVMAAPGVGYSGEASGINQRARKGSNLSHV